MTLQREAWTVPEVLPFGESHLKPLRSGETLAWRLAGPPTR
jgi:dihydroorotase